MRFGFYMSLLVLFFSACTTAQFAPSLLDKVYEKRRSPEEIEVYKTQIPDKKYIEIGSVHACCGSIDKIVILLREKASQAGGDALISIDAHASQGMSA